MASSRLKPCISVVDEYGVSDSYLDAGERWQTTPAKTIAAIHAIMASGHDGSIHNDRRHEQQQVPLIVRPNQKLKLPAVFDLRLEDGAQLNAQTKLPPDLSWGYHELQERGTTKPRPLIVAPSQCYLPDDLRIWGWAAQLYSVRSKHSWGIGDLADLRRLNKWSKRQKAGITLINPLGADTPGMPTSASPYAPSSRCFRNVLYLSIENIPGADSSVPGFKKAMAAGRTLNKAKIIDRDTILELKLGVLERIWARFGGDDAFEAYLREQGTLLAYFTRFCVLAETLGRDWRKWPAKYRHPNSPAVRRFAGANASRIRFYGWIQWLIDRQLAVAAREVPLMQDCPIGVDSGGADAWMWQDVFARGVTAGVPPDLYNQAGQNWSLSVFIPQRLQGAGYVPFVQTIRALLRHAGGLRIDHVMGLHRLFWIPDGSQPSEGAYVHYPVDDLLAILALESHRARAFIVGEDLGTVDRRAQRKFADHRVLSYRLTWFEKCSPENFPRHALASISTHDLPTIAGLWTGQDGRDEVHAGLKSNTAGWKSMRDRLQRQIRARSDVPVDEVIRRTYRSLAKSPSMIITASLEDALAVPHRPNMPGTVDTWPNWSMPLPGGLEAIEESELARSIAKEMQSRQRRSDIKRRARRANRSVSSRKIQSANGATRRTKTRTAAVSRSTKSKER